MGAYIMRSKVGFYRCKHPVQRKAHDFTATTGTFFHNHKKTTEKCAEAIEIIRSNPEISPIEFSRMSGWSYKGAYMFLERVKSA